MGQKKDIGEIFASKLKDGEKNPSSELWNRVDDSLDKQNQLKKKNIIYWFIGGVGVLIIGLSILFGNDILFPNSSSYKREPLIKEELAFPLDPNQNNKKNEIPLQDSLSVPSTELRATKNVLI